MAPAMSIRCMTVPPRMNPSGLASFGRTTWVITENESAGLFGMAGTPNSLSDSFQINSQLPTPNYQKSNAQRPKPQFGSWALGVPWKLEVGSWELRLRSLEVVADPEVELG